MYELTSLFTVGQGFFQMFDLIASFAAFLEFCLDSFWERGKYERLVEQEDIGGDPLEGVEALLLEQEPLIQEDDLFFFSTMCLRDVDGFIQGLTVQDAQALVRVAGLKPQPIGEIGGR